MNKQLRQLQEEITRCRRCPRLVAWREQVAREKTRRFADEHYWGRPVPGFGDPEARLILIGLAPAAHGANRTGRMFTGDRSGDWLYRALYKAGFANQAESVHADDGLRLIDTWVTAPVRCAPPQNKPAREEFENCHEYLRREFAHLDRVRVMIGLGRHGFEHAFRAASEKLGLAFSPRPRFGHLAEVRLGDELTLIGSFHPSQQNTFTGKLTEPMFDAVFERARTILKESPK